MRGLRPAVRERVRRRLERLRDGHWGGGTRVKRLRGVGRPVFEARTDRGDRLLFTVVRSADPERASELTSHLQVWDLLEHDDVERTARRNRSPEAEFLELECLEDFAVEEPPPSPAITFEELPEEGREEPLLAYLLPSQGGLAEPPEGLRGSERWFRLAPELLADAEGFQRLMDQGGAELELKLTAEQYEVLRSPYPLLLAGSAGSGKTTLAVHRLVQEAWTAARPGRRILYLSYSPWLVERAGLLYGDLLRARGLDPESSAARQRRPVFLTFEELYRRILGEEPADAAAPLPAAPAVTFEEFERWWRHSGRQGPVDLLWEELRAILKGACLDLSRTLLEEEAYFELGKKRAPLFVDQRPEIYPLALSYQSWLEGEGRYDGIDLCRRAFRHLRAGEVAPFDALICDEVQDLTELELAFLQEMVPGTFPKALFLAGDTQQILHPSGFRWAEVRSLHHRGRLGRAPMILRLRKNFRSVRPLVELANAILEIRQDLFGTFSGEGAEEAAVEGPFPVEVVDEEEAVLTALEDFGPGCAVIAFDPEEGEGLRQRWGTNRVFTVFEAKGLEFEAVVLWKPAGEALLERLQRPSAAADAGLKRILQELYVAVTRARRHLVVVSGSREDPFWRHGGLGGRLELESAETLKRLLTSTASPSRWAEEGEFYRRRGRYLQAAECYRRAGDHRQKSEARALGAEERGDWPEALRIWTELADDGRRGEALERLGRGREALEIYRRREWNEKVEACEIRLLEGEGAWAAAAEAWQKAGDLRQAARCRRRAGERLAAMHLELAAAKAQGNRRREGLLLVRLRRFAEAEKAFRQGGLERTAMSARGRAFEQEERWQEAASCYRSAGNERRARRAEARFLEAEGRWLEAGALRVTLGDRRRAAALYRKAGEEETADALLLSSVSLSEPQLARVEDLEAKGDGWGALALAEARLEVLEEEPPILPWLADTAEEEGEQEEVRILSAIVLRLTALRFEERGDLRRARRFWQRAGREDRARELLEERVRRQPQPPRRGRLRAMLGDLEGALEELAEVATWENLRWRLRAAAAEAGEDWPQAAAAWQALGDEARTLRCRAQEATAAGDFATARRLFQRGGMEEVLPLLPVDPESTWTE